MSTAPFRIVTFTPGIVERWDQLCDQSTEAWLYHKSIMLQYQMAFRPSLKTKNLSFLILDGSGKDIGICPLYIEEHSYKDTLVHEFSLGGGPLPPVALRDGLSSTVREGAHKFVFEQIDTVARDLKVARVSIRYTPLGPSLKANPLARFGYLDMPSNTQMIDCSQPTDILMKDMRKGHVSDIKRAGLLMDVSVYDFKNITPEVFKAYQALHLKAAGRVTRPQETFDLMYQMVKADLSVLVGARKDSEFIGFALIETYKSRACYSSAANTPELRQLPIAHGIQDATMKWLHANDFVLYELGSQIYGPTLFDIGSDKEQSISLFKRGFGGFSVSAYGGEKFYDSKFAEGVLTNRVQRYVGTLLK